MPFRILFVVAAVSALSVVGCSGSSNNPTGATIGEPAPARFKDMKLELNGRDALGVTLVVAPRESAKFTGSFRFATPVVKGRASIGSVIVHFTMPHKGNEISAQSAGADLKFLDDRRAQFSCEMTAPPSEREYRLKVTGVDTREKKIIIVMQTKVRVKN